MRISTRCVLWICCCLPLVGAELRSDPVALEQIVRQLCDDPVPRQVDQPARLDACAALIATALGDQGWAVEEQVYQVGEHDYRNVIARLGPADAPVLVVGAHYDVAGDGPGADDNASGVAGLLAVAAQVAADADRLTRQVELVAYTLEEPPHFAGRQMGSRLHADALQASGRAVVGMIALEMIGYFTDAPDSQRYPVAGMRALYPSVGNFIAVVSNLESAAFAGRVRSGMAAGQVPVAFLAAPAETPGIGLSDHRNYWAHEMPAVMITDTAFFRNPHYHRSSDRPETLDYQRMAQVCDAVAATVLAIASEAD